MSSGIRFWPAAIVAVYLLFFFGIEDVGVLGPDEPRYASIGREMAVSGDWITPRLWGEEWFEKPALLYWMVAAAQLAGLGDDLAPRVPVALSSVAFLVFFFLWLRRQFDSTVAFTAAAILSTSAGWLAYSQVGVTDLPLAVTFSTAMLLCLPWLQCGDRRLLPLAGLFLGLAILAKGLVPLVLAAPLLWFGRERWRDSPRIGLAAFAVALPWYGLMILRHGRDFVDEFFVRHHFGRFASEELLHQRPWWFYLPVLAGGLFPWTPLLATIRPFRDVRLRFLLAVAAFGFAFFSASTNKLPGYLLPLLPAIAVLIGAGLEHVKQARTPLSLVALLLVVLPVIADVLPRALQSGLTRAGIDWSAVLPALPIAGVALFVRRLDTKPAVALLAILATVGVVYLKVRAYPAMEELVSARSLWREVSGRASETCVDSVHRNWRYGLNYYSVQPLPDCKDSSRPVRIRQAGAGPPRVETGPS
ncbi:MAG: glycosyltransferase family 39 protein [Bryobacteraceae bacterium]|nr:glycosyltransferase family 39 protein [Bryobacteraceae bacterium]